MSIGATVLPMLTEHYADSIHDLWFENLKEVNPILAAAEIKSMEESFGRGFVIPVQYNVGHSVSATFTDAQTANPAKRDRWVVSPVTIHATAKFDRDEIDATKSDDEMFDVISSETDAKMLAIRNQIAQQLPGSGSGAIARILAVNASPAYVAAPEASAWVWAFAGS